MLLPEFRLHRPTSAEEACDLLRRLDEAEVYMGGTELLLLMKLGLAQPSDLVDCKRVPELSGIEIADDRVVVGAGTTIRELERSGPLEEVCGAFSRMASTIANVRIRNVGTLGGNLCFAEPRSDPATLLTALGAEVLLRREPGRERWVALEDFFLGPLHTVREPDELMLKVAFPRPATGSTASFRRFSTGDRPMVNCAVATGAQGAVRVVVGAIGPHAMRIPEAEAVLEDDAGDIDGAVAAVREHVRPRQYEGASEDYERHLAGVVARAAMADVLG